MKEGRIVITNNIIRFRAALRESLERSQLEEGMIGLYGQPGEGKSTMVEDAVIRSRPHGLFLRARSDWSMTTLLRSVMRELDLEAGRYRSDMMDSIIEHLAGSNRTMVIDEADYLFRDTAMLDAVRDIYDNTQIPVVLVGHEDLRKKMKSGRKYARHFRRITKWVHLKGITYEDAQSVRDELVEDVEIQDDLLRHAFQETEGNIGKLVISLSNIEKAARASGLGEVGLADWGNKSLF